MRLLPTLLPAALLALAALHLAAAADAGAESRPQRPLAEVPFTQVHFHDAFWAPRLETNRTVTIPHVFRLCESTGRIDNFAKAAGLMAGAFRGIYYDDSDVYKAIEGASYSLATHPDPALDAYLDALIARIAAAQCPDGYLNTYYTLTGLDQRYTKLWQTHELYCAGHLFEAAVAHHRATGKTTLLTVATRFADQIATVFGPDKRHDVPGHEEIELALVKLANETGNDKYRDLARFFVSARGKPAGRPRLYGPYHQDHTPVIDQTTPTGHAVRQMYLLCGVTDLAATTDPVYVPTLDRMWHSLVDRRMYLTGGIGARHTGEAFGDDYELPNDTAYAETCAAIGNALWQHRMNLLHADAKYADVLERILYNGMLSGVSLSGDRFFYVNPLSSAGHHHRQEWYGTACCPVNLVRFLPSLPGYVYATAPGNLYVNLYAASEAEIPLDGQTIRVAQETRYPWDGLVAVVVRPGRAATAFSLNLRVPAWCADPLITVNDKPVAVSMRDGYARITRSWGMADVVKLDLHLTPRRVHADPHVAADAGRVAVQYGPIVYCAEGFDQPGVRLSSVYLPPDAKLTPEYHHDLLGGVTVIRAKARALSAGSPAAARDVDLTLIPYYAWDNRAPGEMAVWLAEDPAIATPAPPPTLANTSTPSASHVNSTDTLDALADGLPVKDSADPSIPRFTWWDHTGTDEWVQYDFPKPTAVSSSQVYFFDDAPRGGRCRPPESWRLLYKDGDRWRPIEAAYPAATDAFNTVSFPTAVTTTALRLEARLRPGFSAGILEWRVR